MVNPVYNDKFKVVRLLLLQFNVCNLLFIFIDVKLLSLQYNIVNPVIPETFKVEKLLLLQSKY